MPGTRYPSAEGHPPLPPFKGGKSEARGGMLPLQKGECRELTADRCNSPERAVLIQPNAKRWGKR